MDHVSCTGDGEHGNPRVTEESVNIDKCVTIQTRVMKQMGLKPPRSTKVSSIDGLEIGPQQLVEQQRSDETLKRYWQLADKPSVEGKTQFVKMLSLQYHIIAQSAGRYWGLLAHMATLLLVS